MLNNNNEYLKGFERELKIKRLARASCITYIGNVNAMLEYIGKNAKDITRDDIIRYEEYLIELGRESTTIHKHIQSIQLFYKFLERSYNIKNMTEKLPRPNIEYKEPKIVSDKKIQEVFNSCSLEFKCYMILGYEQVMRIGEILKLEVEDLNFEENVMNIRKAKRGTRTPQIGNNARDILIQWINENNIQTGKLFHRTPKSIGENFKKKFEQVGLKWGRANGLTIHTLKHSGISFMVHNGNDVKTVSSICGTGVKVINKIYLHSTNESKMNAVNIFPKRGI